MAGESTWRFVSGVLVIIILLYITYSYVHIPNVPPAKVVTVTPPTANVATPTVINLSQPSKETEFGKDMTRIQHAQENNQSSIDRVENAHHNEVIDAVSHAEIDIAPQGLNNQGRGSGTNMPTERDAITGAFAALTGIKGPMQFIFGPTRNFTDTGKFGRVVDLTPMLSPMQVFGVSLVARMAKIGSVVDLYSIAPIDELKPTIASTPCFPKIAVDNLVFASAPRGWSYMGLINDAIASRDRSKPPTSPQVVPNVAWDVYPWYEMGIAKKENGINCPYPAGHCEELLRFVIDGQTGSIRMSDGYAYSFDGRIVRPIISS
jgi:hypothetical protein